MNDTKLSCLVEGYEGTYFEIGQVWETRDGEKVTLKKSTPNNNYPLLFDVGYNYLERFTLKGTLYKDVKHRFDLVKLISTPSRLQPKTLSEYLKENNAYESFIENCVEDFLNDIDVYNEIKKDSEEGSSIGFGSAFNWNKTKEGKEYWSDLYYNKPNNLDYDMDEIVFAEVDKRLSKEEKASKRYMIFIEGKDIADKIYTDLEKAEEEAKRLATVEVGSKVSIVEIVKEYKSEVIINEVKNNLE